MKRLHYLILPIVIGCLTLLFLYRIPLVYDTSQQALRIWFERLVPALLPSIILIKLLQACGAMEVIAYLCSFLLSPLLGLTSNQVSIVVASMFTGYPGGAILTMDSYQQGEIDEKQATRCLCIASFVSPTFILATIGVGLFQSSTLGWICFSAHFCAGLLVGLLLPGREVNQINTLRNTWRRMVRKQRNFQFIPVVKKAIIDTFTSLFLVGGYVILFSILAALLRSFLPPFIHPYVLPTLEFSSGSISIANQVWPIGLKLAAVSACCSFAGLCVHAQISAIKEQIPLSYLRYFTIRLLHAILAYSLTIIFYSIIVG